MVVIALLAMLVVSALSASLVLVTSAESAIAANFRASYEVLEAADAAASRTMVDLAWAPSLDGVLSGTSRSTFVVADTAAGQGATREAVPSLREVVHRANCSRPTPCTASEFNRLTADRPWGANNPRWQPYAYGPAQTWLPGVPMPASVFTVVLVADDPGERDGDPSRDAAEGQPGSGILALRALAFGPAGARAAIELIVSRREMGRIRVLSWRLLR